MEGTSLSRSKQRFQTETELENQFIKTYKETNGINLVYLSGQNIDRLVTIFRACKRSGKILVIDFYIAIVLTELASLEHSVPFPSASYSNIKVFFPNLLKRKIEKLKRKDLIEQFMDYEITPEQIDTDAKKIVMTVRSSMDYEIKRIKNLCGGKLIYSMWEGYKENPSTERFLSHLIKRGITITTIHTSGHADFYTLQKLLDTIQPVEVVPIHTTEANSYKDIFPGSKIKQVCNGETRSNTS
jgi:ribonuclease J